MPNDQLFAYIKPQLDQGVDRTELIRTLLTTGWKMDDINVALNAYDGIAPSPNAAPTPPAAFAATPVALPGIFALIGGGVSLALSRASTLLPLMLIQGASSLVTAAAGVIVALLYPALTPDAFFSSISSNTPLLIATVVAGVVLLVLALFLTFLGALGMLYALIAPQQIGAGEALRQAWHQLGSYVRLALIQGLVMCGAIAAISIISIALWTVLEIALGVVAVGAPGSTTIPSIILVVVLFVGWIFFALALNIWLGFTSWVFVDGKARGMDALVMSKAIVRGHFWGLMWRFVAVGVCWMIVFVVIGILTNLLGESGVGAGIAGLINQILSLILTPIIIATTFILYSALRANAPTDLTMAKGRGWFRAAAGFGIVGLLLLPFAAGAGYYWLKANTPGTHDTVRRTDPQIKSEIDAIQINLEIYFSEHNAYPTALTELTRPPSSSDYTYTPAQNNAGYKLCAPLSDGSQYCHVYPESTP